MLQSSLFQFHGHEELLELKRQIQHSLSGVFTPHTFLIVWDYLFWKGWGGGVVNKKKKVKSALDPDDPQEAGVCPSFCGMRWQGVWLLLIYCKLLPLTFCLPFPRGSLLYLGWKGGGGGRSGSSIAVLPVTNLGHSIFTHTEKWKVLLNFLIYIFLG